VLLDRAIMLFAHRYRRMMQQLRTTEIILARIIGTATYVYTLACTARPRSHSHGGMHAAHAAQLDAQFILFRRCLKLSTIKNLDVRSFTDADFASRNIQILAAVCSGLQNPAAFGCWGWHDSPARGCIFSSEAVDFELFGFFIRDHSERAFMSSADGHSVCISFAFVVCEFFQDEIEILSVRSRPCGRNLGSDSLS
jgi:hypothetical protein